MSLMKLLLVMLLFCVVFCSKCEEYDNLALGIPSPADYIINRQSYAVGFSKKYKQPLWVIYKLTREEVLNTIYPRAKHFRADPDIPITKKLLHDYKKSGYDRGHMIPAEDLRWSPRAVRESSYFSIISPQLPSFNRGIWRKLENYIRKLAVWHGSIYVLTGIIISENPSTIGKNKIPIPSAFYKTVYISPLKSITILIPNEKTKCWIAIQSYGLFWVNLD